MYICMYYKYKSSPSAMIMALSNCCSLRELIVGFIIRPSYNYKANSVVKTITIDRTFICNLYCILGAQGTLKLNSELPASYQFVQVV